MIDERKIWDQQLSRNRSVERVATDLGLRRSGKHFFCPGCQPQGKGAPELVIKMGQFECFRCGASGDVVGLVKLARGCDLEGAIAWLERQTSSLH